MPLPENVAATYADKATDPSIELHQQNHDTIHAFVNGHDSRDHADVPGVDASLQVLNITDYGAVGDGATDDTAAIQAAIDAAHAVWAEDTSRAAFPVVFLPRGVYRATGSFTWKNCHIIGSGPFSTFIEWDSATASQTVLSRNSTFSNTVLRGLQFRSVGTERPAVWVDLSADDSFDFGDWIEEVYFGTLRDDGSHVRSSSAVVNVHMTKVRFGGCKYAIDLRQGGGAWARSLVLDKFTIDISNAPFSALVRTRMGGTSTTLVTQISNGRVEGDDASVGLGTPSALVLVDEEASTAGMGKVPVHLTVQNVAVQWENAPATSTCSVLHQDTSVSGQTDVASHIVAINCQFGNVDSFQGGTWRSTVTSEMPTQGRVGLAVIADHTSGASNTTNVQVSKLKVQGSLDVGGGIAGEVEAVGAKAYLSANRSVANATVDPVPLASESFDTDAIHDTVTNPSRFTVPAGKAGLWSVRGVVGYAANGTGLRQARLHVNGTVEAFDALPPTGAGTTTYVPIATDVVLAEGDYIELAAYQTSGGSLDVQGGSVEKTWLAAHFVGSS